MHKFYEFNGRNRNLIHSDSYLINKNILIEVTELISAFRKVKNYNFQKFKSIRKFFKKFQNIPYFMFIFAFIVKKYILIKK